MYQLLKLTESFCDTSDKKHKNQENSFTLSKEDKEYINSFLVETGTLHLIRTDIRSYFHFVPLTKLLNLAGEIQNSTLSANLDKLFNKKPLAQKTTLLQVLCDSEDRLAWDKILENKNLGTALTFKLMQENFQLMSQFSKLKINDFSEFWQSGEVKSACKIAISNLRKCLIMLGKYYDLKKLFDMKDGDWSYLEIQNYKEVSIDLLKLIEEGNSVGHHLENIGEFSIDDLADTYVYNRCCQSKKLEEFIAYTLKHKMPQNILLAI